VVAAVLDDAVQRNVFENPDLSHSKPPSGSRKPTIRRRTEPPEIDTLRAIPQIGGQARDHCRRGWSDAAAVSHRAALVLVSGQ
jgi:hypothetical protein